MFIGAACGKVAVMLGHHNPIAFQVDESDVPENAAEMLDRFNILKAE